MSVNSRLTKLLNFLEENPKDSFLLFAVAKEYENNERLDKALFYYRSIQESDPEYIGLYYHLGKLYETLDEPLLALETFNLGIALAQKKVDFHSLSELNNAKMNLELSMNN